MDHCRELYITDIKITAFNLYFCYFVFTLSYLVIYVLTKVSLFFHCVGTELSVRLGGRYFAYWTSSLHPAFLFVTLRK